MRRKEKLAFISLFGDEHVISLLKDFMPMIYEPLFAIYAKGDTGMLLNAIFKLAKSCIQIAEGTQKAMNDPNNATRKKELQGHAVQEYAKALQQLEEVLFLYVREIVKNNVSRQLLLEILNWAKDFFEFGNRNTIIDVQTLTNEQSPPDTHKKILQELERFVRYKQHETEHKKQFSGTKKGKVHPPPFTRIAKYLGPKFRAVLEKFLK